MNHKHGPWKSKISKIRGLWVLENKLENRMEIINWMKFSNDFVSGTNHRTNEEILQMVDEKRSLIGIIQSWHRNWLGHIMRGDSLLRIIIEGRIEGKQKRGRPRMMLLDWMMKYAYSKLKERAGAIGRMNLLEGREPRRRRRSSRYKFMRNLNITCRQLLLLENGCSWRPKQMHPPANTRISINSKINTFIRFCFMCNFSKIYKQKMESWSKQ